MCMGYKSANRRNTTNDIIFEEFERISFKAYMPHYTENKCTAKIQLSTVGWG